jgi:signal transduction histidine kinase
VSLAVVSLVAIAFLIPIAMAANSFAYERALSEGERDAQTIAAVLGATADPVVESGAAVVSVEVAEFTIDAFRGRAGISVIFPDGFVVGEPVEISPAIERARRGEAFSVEVEGGLTVLVPVLSADAPAQESTVVVRKFVPDEELTRGVVPSWLMIGGLAIFLIVVAVLAADRLGRSIVRPMSDLAGAARSLGDGDLDTRVETEGPDEVAEVGEAFNFLADQLETLLAAERESVADLSHRLRTPLTALRLQAERMSTSEEGESLLADIDRMEKAVDRMIAEARAPSTETKRVSGSSDLNAVVRHRAAFWAVLAEEQERSAIVNAGSRELRVPLDAAELGAVIDTLLANVFSYTEPGVGYAVTTAPGAGKTALLVVEDDGEGFHDHSLLERGASGRGSTGLGLDIAARAARQTGGDIVVGNRSGGGARVQVTFGLADDEASPPNRTSGAPPSGTDVPQDGVLATDDGSDPAARSQPQAKAP